MEYNDRLKIGALWENRLAEYTKTTKDWNEVSERYTKKFSEATNNSGSFNMLWSNVKVQSAALFARVPDPQVQRKFPDKNPLARLSSTFLERALRCEFEDMNPMDVYERVVLDMLLVGRGVSWLWYVPTHQSNQEPLAPVAGSPGKYKRESDDLELDVSELDLKKDGDKFYYNRTNLIDQKVMMDYVYWNDFAHSSHRSWKEVVSKGWVARRTYMSAEAGIQRFGEAFKQIEPSDKKSEDYEKVPNLRGVWEIFDSVSRRVFWIADGSTVLLDVKDDPYHLKDFHPCPQPIYATISNESLIPIPDYGHYEPLAEEVDDLTNQINVLVPSLKPIMVVVAGKEGGERIVDALIEPNASGITVVTIEQPSMNLKGTSFSINDILSWFPSDNVAQTLVRLFETRDRIKHTIYELIGISDILRGDLSDPREKFGQTRLKQANAQSRFRPRIDRIQDHIVDGLKLMGEIMCEHFQPDRLRKIGGFDSIPEVQRKMEKWQAEVAEHLKQNPNAPPPIIPEVELNKMFNGIIELLGNEKLRDYLISIESDSTLIQDQDFDQERLSGFVNGVMPLISELRETIVNFPPGAKLVASIIGSVARRNKAGREVEGVVDELLDSIQDGSAFPPPPPQEEGPPTQSEPPNPVDMFKAQLESQKLELEAQKQESDALFENKKLALEEAELAMKVQIESNKSRVDMAKILSTGVA